MKKPKRKSSSKKAAGRIISLFSGVGKVEGLEKVFLHEVLVDEESRPAALVIGFDERFVEALFFDDAFDYERSVFRSGESFSVPISQGCPGRIVDGLGNPLDGLGKLRGERYPVFRPAPPIIDRAPVSTALSTGIKVVDTSLPLGRGQRELIVGDRKIGKSTIAEDTILNQKRAETEVFCVYVICGQPEQKLIDLIELFEKNNAFLYSTVVAATSGTSYAAQYLAPFVGCSIGEYFRDKGKDALVVYDDLSQHAKSYRDISLLLERAPGREAYPGDIFSLHAGLLERAAQLSEKRGGGSLTALPIIETQEGDITSFIPTNLISITDGQIYLERSLFQKGSLPAVNVGLSVSRVGSAAQPETLRRVTGGIRLALAQHKELQKLSQLETAASKEAQKKIFRGELTLELLKQKKHHRVSWEEQVILFYAVEKGFFDDVKKEQWSDFEALLLELLRERYFAVLEEIKAGSFDEKTIGKIQDIIKDFKKEFLAEVV